MTITHMHVATKKVFSTDFFFSIFDCYEGFAFNFFDATVNFRARKKKEKCVCATREREGGTRGACIACET